MKWNNLFLTLLDETETAAFIRVLIPCQFRLCESVGHTYIYLCTYICTCAYKCVLPTCTEIYTYVHVSTTFHTHIYIHVHMYICICMRASNIYGNSHVCIRFHSRSLLQNIVTFVGLFCKRDLWRFHSSQKSIQTMSSHPVWTSYFSHLISSLKSKNWGLVTTRVT